uniref:Phototropic-responsive NPH3 family protein n=1 Tax=Kalanchoe fedtschenkoi TaxID=63787 RepID=A0A7N0UEG4_KALFE
MKFMKLGSKPDCYQTDGNNVRYLATELASDIVVIVEDTKFFLHKFPLLCKSARFQKLAASANEEDEEIHLPDVPGGAAGFELCVKVCYGMAVTLNARNVCLARCAAEYLGMHESVERGNLIRKIEVFLDVSIFRSWKDSITVLKSTKSFSPHAEEAKLAKRCVEAISEMASTDASKVSWNFTYHRRRLRQRGFHGEAESLVPRDWWAEDLSELEVGLYKAVILRIKSRGKVSDYAIGEALGVYAFRKLRGLGRGAVGDAEENRAVVDSIVWLLPATRGSVGCSFMLKLLKSAIIFDSDEGVRRELVRRIAQQLEEASVADLLIRSVSGECATTVYDVDAVIVIVKEYLRQGCGDGAGEGARRFGSGMVAKLIDEYLVEISKDRLLAVAKFVELAGLLADFPRPSHDGLYRAIDTYLKEHPGIRKSDRKSICSVMDCRALSSDASKHAVQNERLPLRVAVQVLMLEQARAATAASACATPNPRTGTAMSLHSRSLRSVGTNSDLNQDGAELKALKMELAKLKLGSGSGRFADSSILNKASFSKFKSVFWSTKIVAKLQHSKSRRADDSTSSGSFESPHFNGDKR